MIGFYVSQDEIKTKIIDHIHISPKEILEEILLSKKKTPVNLDGMSEMQEGIKVMAL